MKDIKQKTTLSKLRRGYLNLRRKWLGKQSSNKNKIQFNINNTFIMPSGFGWVIIAISISLFILGTNLQNNTILLLCYFLGAMLLLSVFHSFFYFTQHTILFTPIQADYENRQFHLPIQIQSLYNYEGGSLKISVKNTKLRPFVKSKTPIPRFDVNTNSPLTHFKLPLPPQVRGIHQCAKITISAHYGFGLIRCWTHLSPQLNIVVYPKMKKSPLILNHSNSEHQLAISSDSQYAISDNLQGIREYQTSDPIHHVSWKHVAKGQGMLTKDFNENMSLTGWLRLSDYIHLGIEEALQCLCFQAQQLEKDHVHFGLDLESNTILPNQGKQHLEECLHQLAIYSPQLEHPLYDKSKGVL